MPTCPPCYILSPTLSPKPCLRWPLQPGAAARHPPPRGLLFVNVVEAVNIPNLDWRSLLSKPDTFVECALLQSLSAVQQSICCRTFVTLCQGAYCHRGSCDESNVTRCAALPALGWRLQPPHTVHCTVSRTWAAT